MDILQGDKGICQFGPFLLDPIRRRLQRDGTVLKLPPKQFDMLLYLVENAGRVVDKDEMMSAVWPGRTVEEGSLSQTVFLLRRALQEDGSESFVVTAPGQGYRFAAAVTRGGSTRSVLDLPDETAPFVSDRQMPAPQAAKLSRPRLPPTLPRWRVFAMLERMTQRRMVWVSGPPGAGKTTAVCSYLDSRQASFLWFVVDAGDEDPAGFFFHLREAARIWVKDLAQLPLLTADYLAALPAFTRRFFRVLIARLPPDSVLVFDNFQEVPQTAALGGILRDAASELGAGACIVVISRQPPPAVFARLRANQELALLGWASLQLTEEETREIVARHTPALAPAAAEIHARSAGWAAGLTLLLETGEEAGDARLAGAENPPQAVFDYFATEIFERAPEETRRVWLSTADLPYFTAADAASLSGDENAARVLESLAHRRYFTDKHASGAVHFRYHALFRSFLAIQADRYFPADERRLLLRRSAELAGDTETALTLFERAGEVAAAVSLLLRQAPALFAQGRWKTLLAWLQRQPQPLFDAQPWLTYWMGACQGQADLQAGFTTMERANLQFTQAQDRVGQAMSACALVQTKILQSVDFNGMEDRLAFLAAFLQTEVRLPSPAMELRVGAVLLAAFTHFNPKHDQVEATLDRVWSLCLLDIGAGDRLMAAASIMLYFACCAGVLRVREAIDAFEPLAAAPETTPLQHCNWYFSKGFALLAAGEVAEWEIAWRRAAAIAHAHGLSLLRLWWPLIDIWKCLLEARLDDAARHLAPALAQAECNGPIAMGYVGSAHTWLALLRDEPELARERAQKCMEIVTRDVGYVASLRRAFILNHTTPSLAACGRADEAIALAREASAWFGPRNIGPTRYLALLTEADTLLSMGRDTEGLAILAEALLIGRRGGHFMTVPWLPKMMVRLCEVALREGIEPDYVRDLATRRNLKPRQGLLF